MSRTRARSVIAGAVAGALLGALLSALVSPRRSEDSRNAHKHLDTTRITQIAIHSLALARQLIQLLR